ncbi:MAG TPA: hypothetical protein VHG33_10665 [Woeseiaceae bacterium]|nr:hypothetical protein [Woeseiaceae bacterium]
MLSKLLMVAMMLGAAPAALAAPPPGDGRFMVAQQDGLSLNEAVERVRQQYRGRIVSAETRLNGNREVHIIKVLTEDGKVKTVRISGRTRG